MPYFSRLTDIVTCNLSSILAQAEDQQAALEEIIFEMTEGIGGAERSVRTANNNVSRIEVEIGEQRTEVSSWIQAAQQALADGNDAAARQALERKHEVEDLIAGLEQQLEAAIATRDHLNTMKNALHARLADAQRRLRSLNAGEQISESDPAAAMHAEDRPVSDRKHQIDAELEELRRQLGS